MECISDVCPLCDIVNFNISIGYCFVVIECRHWEQDLALKVYYILQ